MHANAPDPRKRAWKDKIVRSGYFLGAVLLHLIVFLMVATLVIWKAQPPPPDDEFHAVAVKTPPPPPAPPPPRGDAAANPQMEPEQTTVPVATPLRAVTSFNNSFTIDSSKILNQTLNHMGENMPKGSGLTSGGGGLGSGSGAGTASVFGSETASGNQLSGYFYDLKQTSDKKSTGVDLGKFYGVLTDYINRGWHDEMLDKYYRSKAPLYTDYFAISTRNSADAPKAFHLENEVQPSLWAIHYHGKVTPPHGGDYRFMGFADNVLVVKIDGTTVLDGGWSPLLERTTLRSTLPFKFPSYYGTTKDRSNPFLKIGPVFHLDEGVAVDMDVLIGDDGGSCNFFLLIKQEDKTYDTAPDGTAIVPFFQLGSKAAPTFKDNEEHPPFSSTADPWQAAAN